MASKNTDKVLVVNSLHFMKKLFYHESTKRRKDERKEKFRAFVVNPFWFRVVGAMNLFGSFGFW